MKIPKSGLSKEEIGARLSAVREGDVPWRSGKVWAYVYDAGRDVESVTKSAFMDFLTENGLDPTAFPSLLKLENEVVGAVASHLNAPETAAGTFTSGGTESILLAVKAARDRALSARPDLGRPHMVLPSTAHAAFQKAAHYLGLDVTIVPVDASYRADVAAMDEAITDRTVLLVGSAVSYAHGVLDPIEALGKLASDRGLLLHVDACIGGFVLPYFRRLGADLPPFDFSVPGVTSMSCDLHKYGFAPKGASVVLYRDAELRSHQFYACATWTGYTIVNAAVQSGKSGGPLAAAWAALKFIGDDGYMALSTKMYEATRKVCEGIEAHPDLHLLAAPDANLVAIASDTVDVFHVVDEMSRRGWTVQAQLTYGNSPANIHLSVNPRAVECVEELLADLDASVAAARGLPSGHVRSLVESLNAAAGDPPSRDAYQPLFDALGVDGGGLPDRMAPINEALDALPPSIREQLLIEFMGTLFTADRG